MASSNTPKILSLLAGGVIPKGSAVKFGSDSKHVVVGAAASDLLVGIAQNAASAAEDVVEVSVDGGAKGLAGGTISKGALLTSNGSGQLVSTTNAGDRVVGVAFDDAVSGDLFDVEVSLGSV